MITSYYTDGIFRVFKPVVCEEGFLRNTDTDDTVHFIDFLAYVRICAGVRKAFSENLCIICICMSGFLSHSTTQDEKESVYPLRLRADT